MPYEVHKPCSHLTTNISDTISHHGLPPATVASLFFPAWWGPLLLQSLCISVLESSHLRYSYVLIPHWIQVHDQVPPQQTDLFSPLSKSYPTQSSRSLY